MEFSEKLKILYVKRNRYTYNSVYVPGCLYDFSIPTA